MTCVTAEEHLVKEMLSTDVIDFFSFNVIFPKAIKFCVLMAAIPDSASVFGDIIAVFSYTLKVPLLT